MNNKAPIGTMRLSGYPSSRHACLTGAIFINFATLSKSRKSIAIALITRPVQSFHLGTESVRTADSMTLSSFDRKLGPGLSMLIFPPNRASIYTSNEEPGIRQSLLFFSLADSLNQNRRDWNTLAN